MSSAMDDVKDVEKHHEEVVDVHNDKAFKGDESDGAVEWTARSKIAALSLGCLYTGN